MAARSCMGRMLQAIKSVERSNSHRACAVTSARKLEKEMHVCHGQYDSGVERRANRALDKFEGQCGTLPWKNLDGAGKRRRRRRR